MFCLASVLLEAWGAKAKKPHIFKKRAVFGIAAVFGLAAEGGKAKQTVVSGKCVVFWPWRSQASKKHLAKKRLRDPFEEPDDVRVPDLTGQ